MASPPVYKLSHFCLSRISIPRYISIAEIEIIIGHDFTNLDLLLEALELPGLYIRSVDGNRRIAIVGDAALDDALSKEWFLNTNQRNRKCLLLLTPP